jgi:hypothetical protein
MIDAAQWLSGFRYRDDNEEDGYVTPFLEAHTDKVTGTTVCHIICLGADSCQSTHSL